MTESARIVEACHSLIDPMKSGKDSSKDKNATVCSAVLSAPSDATGGG